MCLQCMTLAEIVDDDFLPGYVLMQAKETAYGWHAGGYGIVDQNDPDLIFNEKPLADPLAGLQDEEVAMIDNGDPRVIQSLMHLQQCDRFDDGTRVDMLAAYHLVSACVQEGFDPDDEEQLSSWLLNRMAASVLRHETGVE